MIVSYFPSVKQWCFALFVGLATCAGGELASAEPAELAEKSRTLYEVVVDIPDRTDAERQEAVQKGLAQVLLLVSGNEKLLQQSDIQTALREPMPYVAQYGYHEHQIEIQFSSDLIQQLIFKQQDAIWGEARPTVILWVGVSDHHEKHILGEEAGQLQQDLRDYAQARGLPILFPLVDLKDMQSVSVQDIWGPFPSVLAQASKRYDADVMVRVKMQETSEGAWDSAWELVSKEDTLAWHINQRDFEGVLKAGIDQVIQRLQPYYGLQTPKASQKPILVHIWGIESAEDFTQAEKYIRRIDQVSNAIVKQIDKNKVVFEVRTEGHIEAKNLAHWINKIPNLKAMDMMDDQPSDVSSLNYLWVP